MSWLADPRIFSFAVLALFGLATVRFAVAGDWPQAGYNFGAVVINVAVLAMAK